MQIEVIASARTLQGTGASRRLRRRGKVPGIIYGADKPAQPIELDHNALYHSLKQEAFHASILNMDVGGAKEQVLLRDVQMHPFRQEVLHVDFQRVAKDQKIHMKVPLHFVNAEIAPGVKLHGGVISHVMAEVDITCLPADLPEYVEVDLANLDLGHSVHLGELNFPKGVESVALVRGEDPVVATVQIPRSMVAEEAVAEAAPSAEAAPAPAAEKKEPEKKEPEKK